MLPAPVDKRFEFVSPGWIDSARSFMTQFVAQHSELRTESYSMCEAFDDAPPAFDLPNRRAAWYWRLSNGVLDVGAGEIADVLTHPVEHWRSPGPAHHSTHRPTPLRHRRAHPGPDQSIRTGHHNDGRGGHSKGRRHSATLSRAGLGHPGATHADAGMPVGESVRVAGQPQTALKQDR